MSNTVQIVDLLAESVKVSSNSKPADLEHQQLCKETLLCWRILLSGTKIGPDGKPELVPADLAPAFEVALSKTSSGACKKALSCIVSKAVTTASRSTHHLDKMVEFQSAVLNMAMADCFRIFNFCMTPLNVNHHPAKSQITLFNFLPRTVNSMQFQSLEAKGQQVTTALLEISKKEPAALAKSKLYLGGCCTSITDVVKTLCSCRILLKECVVDFDNTQL